MSPLEILSWTTIAVSGAGLLGAAVEIDRAKRRDDFAAHGDTLVWRVLAVGFASLFAINLLIAIWIGAAA